MTLTKKITSPLLQGRCHQFNP